MLNKLLKMIDMVNELIVGFSKIEAGKFPGSKPGDLFMFLRTYNAVVWKSAVVKVEYHCFYGI